MTIFWQDFQNWNLLFAEVFFGRKSLLEKFYQIMNVLRASVEFFYGRIVKTAVHNFRGTFFVKPFVWKSYRFISFLRASGENFSAGLSKLLSNVTEKHCKRKFFSEKNLHFHNFRRASGLKLFQTVVKTAF